MQFAGRYRCGFNMKSIINAWWVGVNVHMCQKVQVSYLLGDVFFWVLGVGIAVDGTGKDQAANISLFKKRGKVKGLDEELYSMLYLFSLTLQFSSLLLLCTKRFYQK